MTVAQLRTLLAPLRGDLAVEIAGEADPTDLDAVVEAWSTIRDASTPVPRVLDRHPLGQFFIDAAEFCREERDAAERAEHRPPWPVEPDVKRADLYRRRWRRLRGNRGLR